MIRFAWMQFRTNALVAGVGLIVLAIPVVITGAQLTHLYDTTVSNCATLHDCSAATSTFTDSNGFFGVVLTFLLVLAPALIGMFWGAPLVASEYESGTYRLAWTQGVTRRTWLGGKLALGAAVSMLAVGLLSLMVTRWSSLQDLVNAQPYDPWLFGARGIVPIGYAAFAFALGVAAGLLTRRMLPAMLIALAGFVAVRYTVTKWVRPHLAATLHTLVPIGRGAPLSFGGSPSGATVQVGVRGALAHAWVLSNRIVDASGQAPTQAYLNHACPFNQNTGITNIRACTASLTSHFRELVTYQPQSHYWNIQSYEFAIFMGLAILLGGLCFLLIRRPVS